MKIFTSYFSNIRQIPNQLVLISICGKAPDWYKGIQYRKLAPSYDIYSEYKESNNEERYTERFQKERLSKLDRDEVLKELEKLSSGRDIVLLCYEKPFNFCHRHLVADWLGNITEFGGSQCLKILEERKEKYE